MSLFSMSLKSLTSSDQIVNDHNHHLSPSTSISNRVKDIMYLSY